MSALLKSLLAITATATVVAAGGAHAFTAERYLTWEAKARMQSPTPAPVPQTPSQSAPQGGGNYGVPASPYGQVGNPYRQTLNWPGKAGPQMASIAPVPQPSASAPVFAPAVAVHRPIPRPEPVRVEPPQPQSPPVSSYQPRPEPALRPAPMPEPMAQQPLPAPQPRAEAAQPGPVISARPEAAPRLTQPLPPPPPVEAAKPVSPPVAVAPPPAPAQPTAASGVTMDSGYQVPTTSKYAARIAAARAAQAGSVEAPPPAAEAPTVPVQSQTLASQETDDVFIPGERITDAMTQEPRRYSLHRQFGLQPDRIMVDPTPNGAILETTFDALESQDEPEDTPDASGETP